MAGFPDRNNALLNRMMPGIPGCTGPIRDLGSDMPSADVLLGQFFYGA